MTAVVRLNTLNDLKDFCNEHGSNQGQNLALTLLFATILLDSGPTIGLWLGPYDGPRTESGFL